MQEPTTYPRLMIMKILPLLSGILFLITTILQLAMGNPVAFLTGIVTLLFLVNGIWSVSTPYAITTETQVTLKMSLLASLEVVYADVEKVQIESEKLVVFICRGGEKKVAKLHGMASDHREDFIKDV